MSVTPLDPVAPEERVTVCEAILDTCRELQRIFPDLDLSDEIARCEAARDEANEIKQRREWLEQRNQEAVSE